MIQHVQQPNSLQEHPLRQARRARGWTQEDVAERIEADTNTVGRWERRLRQPSAFYRRRLIRAFGMSAEELGFGPRAETGQTAQEAEIFDLMIPSARLPLVGREEQMQQLRDALCQADTEQLITLTGMPGVGKTALAVAVTLDDVVGEHLPDVMLWVGLGPSPNLEALLSRWGTLLGLSEPEMTQFHTRDAWIRALRSAIGMRKTLLIIDDAWRMEDVTAFMVGGPQCRYLVTTRRRDLAAQISLTHMVEVPELSLEESIQLLRTLVPEVVVRESRKVEALVQAVGGLPLALTIMGQYLRQHSYTGLSRRMMSALDRLTNAQERMRMHIPTAALEPHPGVAVDSHVSLHAMIALSDAQLEHEEREALYALSVFPAKPVSFSEEAALAVTQAPAEVLDALVDAGLLESVSDERYSLHQTIADYTRLQRQSSEAQERLIAFVQDFLRVHASQYALLAVEHETIRSALEVSWVPGQQVAQVQIVCAYLPFLLVRGFYGQAERWLKQASRAAIQEHDEQGIISLASFQGELALKRGNVVLATQCFQEALSRARKLHHVLFICEQLLNVGRVALARGALNVACHATQEALKRARELERHDLLCRALLYMGEVYYTLDQREQARPLLIEALRYVHTPTQEELHGRILIVLGRIAQDGGQLTEAEKHLREAHTHMQMYRQSEWHGAVLTHLAVVLYDQAICYDPWQDSWRITDVKRLKEAKLRLYEALELARAQEHRVWIVSLLILKSRMSLIYQQWSNAASVSQEALVLARQIGLPLAATAALLCLGKSALHQQRWEEATRWLREALMLAPDGHHTYRAWAHFFLAQVAAAQGHHLEAQRFGQASAERFTMLGMAMAPLVEQWTKSVPVVSTLLDPHTSFLSMEVPLTGEHEARKESTRRLVMTSPGNTAERTDDTSTGCRTGSMSVY